MKKRTTFITKKLSLSPNKIIWMLNNKLNTMLEIFDALQPNIVSVPQFRDEVLMRNNFKEQLPMGVLFGDYGF
jgi:hypothetical protein